MLTPDTIELLKNQVSNAESILVVFPAQVKFDQVASALSLFLGLEELKKNVTVASPAPVTVGLSSLVGIDRVSNQLGNKNLQVTFDYKEEAVDKVSYHIDEESRKFHLVIQPKKGAKPLLTESVMFSYTGVEADLVFVVGAHSLDDLEQLYYGQEEFFQNTTVVSINSYETTFGSIKVSTAGSASSSEVMAYLLQELGVTLSADIATNLLAGIEDATNSFTSLAASADTFEIAAKLLRLGARRVHMTSPSSPKDFMNAFAQVGKSETKKKEELVIEESSSQKLQLGTSSPALSAPQSPNSTEKKPKSKSNLNPPPRMEGGGRV